VAFSSIRLREQSALALRLPRTAPRGDFDLIALRARCDDNDAAAAKLPIHRRIRRRAHILSTGLMRSMHSRDDA